MVEISIGLGIILSLVLSEALGVTAGGIIVPGYIALFLHQPIQVVSTFTVAVIVLIIIKLLSRVMFLRSSSDRCNCKVDGYDYFWGRNF